MSRFLGYLRSDGRVGVRNHVVVMSSVSCANAVVLGIGRQVPQVKTVTHTEGCGRGPTDIAISLRTLAGVASHPNVAAILIIGLGCEFIKARLVADYAANDKRIEQFEIQEVGGTPKAIARGVEIARRMLADASKIEREEFGFEHLTLAMECGGSDAMSGLTANPSVGVVADWLVGQGGTVMLSEVTEFLGTEEILATRCASGEVREQMLGLLSRHEVKVKEQLGPLADLVIAPGNQEGGLSSIQEKSLGCIQKGGTTDIQAVLEYAERPTKKGLHVMDTPGSDIFSVTGMFAAGAQMMLFTTGRGSPAGSPLGPVVKVASNTSMFQRMRDDMDFDAGRVMAGMSIAECGAELVGLVGKVADGKPTAAELNNSDLFAIHTVGEAF